MRRDSLSGFRSPPLLLLLLLLVVLLQLLRQELLQQRLPGRHRFPVAMRRRDLHLLQRLLPYGLLLW